MGKYICINCGVLITKSALYDPYICMDCEKLLEKIENRERHNYLENY